MKKLIPFAFVALVAASTCGIMVGAFHAGVAMAQPADDAGVAAPAPSPAPAVTPVAPAAAPKLPAPPSVDQVTKLWRGGAFLVAGIFTLYLLLTLAAKLDKKHAFYIAAGLASVGIVVDAVNRGETPTIGMLIGAAGTLASIIVKGPDKKTTGETSTTAS